MVEVSGASQHGRYEIICLNSLCVMSNVNVFAIHDRRKAGWLADRTTNTTQYIDPPDTHMDQKPFIPGRRGWERVLPRQRKIPISVDGCEIQSLLGR